MAAAARWSPGWPRPSVCGVTLQAYDSDNDNEDNDDDNDGGDDNDDDFHSVQCHSFVTATQGNSCNTNNKQYSSKKT